MKRLEFDPASIESAWTAFEQSVGDLLPVRSARQYRRAVRLLNALLDVVGADERQPLAGLLDVLGDLVSAYEARAVPMPDAEPREALRLLMEANSLTQTDLGLELGGQPVVSAILNGKRAINARQASAGIALRRVAGGIHRARKVGPDSAPGPVLTRRLHEAQVAGTGLAPAMEPLVDVQRSGRRPSSRTRARFRMFATLCALRNALAATSRYRGRHAMFTSDFSASQQHRRASSDLVAARSRNAAAIGWEGAIAAPVGLSAGGLVLVTLATVLGACMIALPIKFAFSWLPEAGCWTLAALYLLTAAHWLRTMLREGDIPAAHKP